MESQIQLAKAFAKLIVEKRQIFKLGIKEFAKKLGISLFTIRAWERKGTYLLEPKLIDKLKQNADLTIKEIQFVDSFSKEKAFARKDIHSKSSIKFLPTREEIKEATKVFLKSGKKIKKIKSGFDLSYVIDEPYEDSFSENPFRFSQTIDFRNGGGLIQY